MTDIVDRLRQCWAPLEIGYELPNDPVFVDTGDLKAAVAEIEWLRGERNRLAADLAKAHLDIVAWIAKAQARYAEDLTPPWKCPINLPGCTQNCCSYGCGN